jgi:hypothetical protein
MPQVHGVERTAEHADPHRYVAAGGGQTASRSSASG